MALYLFGNASAEHVYLLRVFQHLGKGVFEALSIIVVFRIRVQELVLLYTETKDSKYIQFRKGHWHKLVPTASAST